MRRLFTIRSGLAATIAGYTLLLMLVIAAATWCIDAGNASLKAMYFDDTAALLHLKTSSERMLVLRGGFREIEQMISAGKDAKPQIARSHQLLAQSDEELDVYRRLHVPDTAERSLLDKLQASRQALIEQVLQKSLSQLDADDMIDFLTTQREAPVSLFTAYQEAIEELEAFQVARQKARFERADARFRRALWALGAAGVLALLVGLIAQRALMQAIVKPINLAVEHFNRIATGDLTGTVAIARDNEMGFLMGALKRMQEGLTTTVRQVRASTDTIVSDARAIAGGNLDLSSRTEQQAASVQEAAASVEQLTATVQQNANNARSARAYAADASQIATRGGEAMQLVVATMDEITESSTRIGGIVGVIDGIAFQTNILALNAAVEAARAGEQGRGFAVVAAEVRNLAQRSGAAAREIKALIGESTQKVAGGSKLVTEAGSTMADLVRAVERLDAIMSEISLASDEQSTGIEQVNITVTQMEESMQRNAALVEEASAVAMSLEEQSRRLSEAVARFSLRNDGG
ncbi:methyl-accepting chemotaxis protein [Trinickia symbiotica]|uniref:Methyl-accepting chemotaxis protein n=1 Tax=Trinickia symbiotica TaxID=863227 RepID=A0A2T3XRY5_9BURK|nr:methyl-accepting chemotaxis protein [Trinickia symbiotica]PTB19296.1 methyl-accepting chemotaxis protein [Trinickia symbiotica]